MGSKVLKDVQISAIIPETPSVGPKTMWVIFLTDAPSGNRVLNCYNLLDNTPAAVNTRVWLQSGHQGPWSLEIPTWWSRLRFNTLQKWVVLQDGAELDQFREGLRALLPPLLETKDENVSRSPLRTHSLPHQSPTPARQCEGCMRPIVKSLLSIICAAKRRVCSTGLKDELKLDI